MSVSDRTVLHSGPLHRRRQPARLQLALNFELGMLFYVHHITLHVFLAGKAPESGSQKQILSLPSLPFSQLEPIKHTLSP